MSQVTIEAVAAMTHEANRILQRIGDQSVDPPWDKLPADAWQIEASIKGVKAVLAGETDPAAEHERWYKVRYAQGWRWGKVRNSDLKQNPAMVPYHNLPSWQQAKDVVRIAIVMSMAQYLPRESET